MNWCSDPYFGDAACGPAAGRGLTRWDHAEKRNRPRDLERVKIGDEVRVSSNQQRMPSWHSLELDLFNGEQKPIAFGRDLNRMPALLPWRCG